VPCTSVGWHYCNTAVLLITTFSALDVRCVRRDGTCHTNWHLCLHFAVCTLLTGAFRVYRFFHTGSGAGNRCVAGCSALRRCEKEPLLTDGVWNLNALIRSIHFSLRSSLREQRRDEIPNSLEANYVLPLQGLSREFLSMSGDPKRTEWAKKVIPLVQCNII